MANGGSGKRFVFPKWSNALLPFLILNAMGGPLYMVVLGVTGLSPQTTDVGYMPNQPVEYSHAMHAGELGIDCRYCHNTVETSRFASIPPTQTCMNCHNTIQSKSEIDKLAVVKESAKTGMPIEWLRVHDLPDYAYFNHSAHVSKGVGCYECHGRVDKMEQVFQAETLSMGWCLDCHRDPGPNLRPLDKITDMTWHRDMTKSERRELGGQLAEQFAIKPTIFMESCSTCHR